MAFTFAASCFTTAAPGSRRCTVDLDHRWLTIRPEDDAPVRWPYEAVTCEVTGEERAWLTLSCPKPVEDGVTAVVFRDLAVVAAVASRLGEPGRTVLEGFAIGTKHHAPRERRAILLALIGLALAGVVVWLSYSWLAPVIAAEVIPVATERQLGSLIVEGMLVGQRRIKGGPAHEALGEIVVRLTASVVDTGYTFTVHVIEDPRVNAFALPGGQIVVFTGMLAEAGSAEEVAGVLAHEMQHVLHRHGVKQLVRQFGAGAVISMATGGGDLAGLAGRIENLAQLSYSREQEEEADRDGLLLLHRAGLPVESLQSFFERLHRQPAANVPEFLSTHPDTPRRIEDLRRHSASLPPATPRPLGIDWQRVVESLDDRDFSAAAHHSRAGSGA